MAANNILLQNNFLKRLRADISEFKEKSKDVSELYVTSVVAELETEFSCARDRHNKISVIKSAEATKYVEDDVFRNIRQSYHELWAALHEALPASTSTSRIEDPNMHSTMRPQCNSWEVKLPKIDIPEFHGSYDKWLDFINLFTSLVHNSTSLEPVHKLKYLQNALKGDAFKIIKNLELNDDNYARAMKILKDRFHHKRRIVNAFFKKIFKAHVITQETSEAFKNLVDTIHDCTASLNKLEVTIPDYVIIYHTIDILPTETMKEWEESLGVHTELPSLELFTNFLETKFRVLEMTETNCKNPKKTQKSFHIQTENSNGNNNKPQLSKKKTIQERQLSNSKKVTCLICRAEHHFSKCDEYSRMPQQARLDYVKRCRLCINCLRSSHSSSHCRSRFSCLVCKQKHHTTLHRYENSTTQSQQVDANVPGHLNAESHHTTLHRYENPTTQSQQVDANVLGHLNAESFPQADNRNFHIQSATKLLGTARVKAVGSTGSSMIIRALVDPCSTDNYITASTANSLRLKRYYEPTEVLTMGQQEPSQCSHRVNLQIQSSVGEFSTNISAAVVDQITTDMPTTEIPLQCFGYLAKLPLSDPLFNRSCSINILLGVDVHALIKIDETKRYGNLIAENTLFGYLIRGSASDKNHVPRRSTVMLTRCSTYDLQKQIQKFWETEELIPERPQNPEEILCEEIFQSSLTRSSSGHLSVNLPFKTNREPTIGPSRFMAVRRFLTVEKKLESNSELKAEYHKQIREYIDSKHLVKVSENLSTGKEFYLPHHAVIKESSTTTKVRVVFDASCKSSDGTSLNDHLMTGPKLQTDIRDVLFSWRQFPIPLIADIEKMYRMFGINPIHHDYQRIVWRFSPNEPLEDWKLTTITFGTSSAPYQAIRLLRHIANECKDTHPFASNVIKKHFYVDDCIAGGYSVEEAVTLKTQLLDVLKPYGLNLRKWNSSCNQVLETMSPELLDTKSDLAFDETQYSKTLGVFWSKCQDSFHFNIDLSKYSVNNLTKRQVLSLIARLYDPLGFVSPCTMLSKQVMQRIWQTPSGWDDRIDEIICKDFCEFLNELHLLREIKIPRWINLSDQSSDVSIFGFCDASQKGYGAVIYLLDSQPTNSSKRLILLSSKTKVADLKYESIARLELNGAVLLAELLSWAVKQFLPRKSKVFAFCDSQIVLAWLQTNPAKWKTFIANRATKILEQVSREHWHYVDTKNNPADFASRGLLPSQLIHNDMWWFGPDINNLNFDTNLTLSQDEESFVNESVNRKSIVLQISSNELSIITKYSSHATMIRKVRYITKVPLTCLRQLLNREINTPSSTANNVNSIEISNSNGEDTNQIQWEPCSNSSTAPIDTTKINRYSELILRLEFPENLIFRLLQQTVFSEEIKALSSNQQLPKKSKLKGLFPFLDKFGVLRVGGRLHNAELSYSQKHPIILASKHQVTRNIISDAHDRTLHGTESLTLAYLRNRYHIPRASEAVRQFIHKCNLCFKYAKQQQIQLMGSLPPYRVQLDRAFQNSGVDYAGPISIKAYPGRCKKILKSYVAVFVCLGSKALHLDLVSDLSSNAFLAAYKRFTSRRGRCHNLYSDNGTNFVGAARILTDEIRKAEKLWKTDLEIDFESMGTNWHFIPPATPNFGGLWEAGVKSIKNHLKKTIGTALLTYEELSTVLIQIEGVLNSRPLCPISNNPNEYNVLTPAHFLIGEPIVAPLSPFNISESKPPTNRWNHLQFSVTRFIRLWKRDYLQTLQNRPKNQFETENLSVNDLVLLTDDDMPVTLWPTVIVDEIHPGRDGLVRVVTVRNSKGKTFKRPISKLRKLPCNSTHQ